jgi:hypothetical protein
MGGTYVAGNYSATSHMRTHCCVDVDGNSDEFAGGPGEFAMCGPAPAGGATASLPKTILTTKTTLVDRRHSYFFELGARFGYCQVQPQPKLLRLHAGRQCLNFHELLEDPLKLLDASASDFHGHRLG